MSLFNISDFSVSMAEKWEFCHPAAPWHKSCFFNKVRLGLYPQISMCLRPPTPNVISVTVPFFPWAATSRLIFHTSLEFPCAVLTYVSELGWKIWPGSFQSELFLLAHLWGKRKIWLNIGKCNHTQCESVQRSADFSDDLKPLNCARADMHHYLILSSLPWIPLISICPSPLCLCSFMPFFKVDCKAFGTKISGMSVNGKDRMTPHLAQS